MTPHGLRRLLIRVAILGAPLLLLGALYVVLDPFEVLHPHATFYGPAHMVPLNRDFVSTEIYLHHPLRRELDSFVFGNSRSTLYRTSDWVQYIHATAPFHFDASGESIFGIWSKVRFLHNDGRKIRNALIILDADTLSITGDSPGYLLKKHPRVAGTSVIAFHYEFFSAFLYPQFFARYLGYRAVGSIRPWMGTAFQDGPRELWEDPRTNDMVPIGIEKELAKEGEAFFVKLARTYPRDLSRRPPPSAPTIGPQQRKMLEEIARIVAADGGDLRVVINPLYDRMPLNPADVAELRRIFGAQRVFDFSGSNAFTDDVHNYYENSHFRPQVARQILRIVYAGGGTIKR